MREQIEERCILIGQAIADNGMTVRAAAELFGVSKSSVHVEVMKRNALSENCDKGRGCGCYRCGCQGTAWYSI